MLTISLVLSFVSVCFYFFLDVRLETDERSRGKMQNTEASITKWIRKDLDADGYFLLQVVERYRTRFLTADNVSSLTLQGIYTDVKTLASAGS